MNLRILPKDKQDIKSVEVLARMDRAVVVPFIPDLLIWLQDINWPIASAMVELLLKYKVETIPHIKSIFSQNDYVWSYNILAYLLKEWEPDLVSKLTSNLLELARNRDEHEDIDLLAIDILWSCRLIEANDVTALLQEKMDDTKGELDRFTVEQIAVYKELEIERLSILNSDVKQIVTYIDLNRETLNQKVQYENWLRRHQEIEVMARNYIDII